MTTTLNTALRAVAESGPEPFDPEHSPGMTDLMVTPEAVEDHFAANPPAPTTYPDTVVAGAKAMYEAINNPQSHPRWNEIQETDRAYYCRAFAAGLEAYLRAETTSPQPRTTVEDDVLHVDLPADKYDVTPTGCWKKKPRTSGDAA